MISKREQKALKNLFGNHYTSNVIAVLELKGVKDTSNKTHSSEMIRQVFNGKREHEEIEEAIIEAALIEKKKLKDLKRKKEKLLKSIQ
jgi:hypothetical protein